GILELGFHLYAFATTSLVGYTNADLGSAEAEYRGVANVAPEATWIRNSLRELLSPFLTATLVYCDNVSAIYMSANPVQHQRTKYIEIDIHFIHDMVKAGHVRQGNDILYEKRHIPKIWRVLHVVQVYEMDKGEGQGNDILYEKRHILKIWRVLHVVQVYEMDKGEAESFDPNQPDLDDETKLTKLDRSDPIDPAMDSADKPVVEPEDSSDNPFVFRLLDSNSFRPVEFCKGLGLAFVVTADESKE
nr:hypothetical protein [Tanacetum cinerariifolium]